MANRGPAHPRPRVEHCARASAIVDFTYFDLLLEHGFAPDRAVQAVRSMITFAGPRGREGDPIPGTDLVMHGLAIHGAAQ